MKRTFISVSIVAICLALFGLMTAPIGIANAKELDYDECDQIFIQTVENLLDGENYTGDITVTASKEPLYDIKLNDLGAVYDFSVNGEGGYAIAANEGEGYEITEIFFDAENPYENCKENKLIYVRPFMYLSYDEGFELVDGTPVEQEVVDSLAPEAMYGGSGGLTSSSERVYYKTRDNVFYTTALRIPNLMELANLPSACAPIAGANIIQYWDRFYENLIPNYTPGAFFPNTDQFIYAMESEETNNLIRTLYNDMGTTADNGTNINMFKNGISIYCARQGYSVQNHQCFSNGSLDYNYAKQLLESGEPIVLFMQSGMISDFGQGDNYEIINSFSFTRNHAMTAFGYRDITYTFDDGSQRKDNYLYVASGDIITARGYYCIHKNTVLNDAFGVRIF